MVRRVGGVLVVSVALTLVAAACSYNAQPTTVVHLANPGKCVAVDIAAAPATASLLGDVATRYNGSPAANLQSGGCAFVRISTVDSSVAMRELVDNWPDAERLGPPPVAWVPGSSMWGQLLDARLAAKHSPAIAPNGTPFAHSPLVIAMPAPMATALDYPHRAIGWRDLEQLAHDPRGWAAYGHPEWGPFRLGKGNPNWSTTGLDQTVALDASPAAGGNPSLLEQSVVYYSDTTQVYFDNWQRLAAKNTKSALTYLSAAITDERSVVAYDTGHAQADVALDGHATRPTVPLVAIYPKDASIESDNPIIVLRASWASAAARAGARSFTKFALQPAAQAKVAAAGYRPARGTEPTKLLTPGNGVDPKARSTAVAPSSPAAIEQALAHWAADRRPAQLLFLFDLSDSMGDPADPAKPHGPTKIDLARRALTDALDQLGPTDDVGLRTFTTKVTNSASPNWHDVVASGPLSERQTALQQAIAALTPAQGSPLYAATRDAFDQVARHVDPRGINGVVLLTDGYNEDDHDTDLDALLTHLGANPSVHVFTITYSNDADAATLRRIAQATDAWNFDARDTSDLAEVLPRALASF